MSIFKKKENRVRVLFIDQKNDFASQMAEYFTTKFYSDRYEAFSAGPEPDIIDCELISAMYQNGEDMRRQVSKDFENETRRTTSSSTPRRRPSTSSPAIRSGRAGRSWRR